MKSKTILIFSILLIASITRAQYVTIPDTAFGSWLNQHGFTACLTGSDNTGWQLDTTCPAVLADTSIGIFSSPFIKRTDGLQYFKNVASLFLIGDSFHTIAFLPPFLKELSILNTNLYSLPPLPSTLTALLCSFNFYFDSLPPLPNALTYLECNENLLRVLPPLPPTLVNLECYGNRLTVLPTLPNTLNNIDCSNNLLNELPALPDSLNLLNCTDNPHLQCLPHLNKIVDLQFLNTAITCLPNAPLDNTTMYPLNTPICNVSCYPLGINTPSLSDVKMYPNPASNILYVDYSTQNSSFVICDMTGRVCSVPITGNQIDVSSLPSGIYYLRIQNIDGSVVKKFVRE